MIISTSYSDEPPSPVLFNPWKHHVGWIRGHIESVAQDADLETLAQCLVVVGSRLMDLYHGSLTVGTIGKQVMQQLQGLDVDDEPAYRDWLHHRGGYAVLTLPDDGSFWTVRAGPEGGRFVHLHPGRYSPHTIRVQANPLKTTIMAHALSRLWGREPDRELVNIVRIRYLQLPPVAQIHSTGLGELLQLLA